MLGIDPFTMPCYKSAIGKYDEQQQIMKLMEMGCNYLSLKNFAVFYDLSNPTLAHYWSRETQKVVYTGHIQTLLTQHFLLSNSLKGKVTEPFPPALGQLPFTPEILDDDLHSLTASDFDGLVDKNENIELTRDNLN